MVGQRTEPRGTAAEVEVTFHDLPRQRMVYTLESVRREERSIIFSGKSAYDLKMIVESHSQTLIEPLSKSARVEAEQEEGALATV